MILVSPTDRELLKILGDKAMSHLLPESYGGDVLIANSGRGILSIQRKTFPDDLVASIADGRLAREISLLKLSDFPVLIAEGQPSWTSDGNLMDQHKSRWTKQQFRNMFRSLWRYHGISVERTDSIEDTKDAVLEYEHWWNKDTHVSALARPKSAMRNSWGKSNDRDFARFFLQGIPGVGSVLAEQIFDHFGRVPLRWDCRKKDLHKVYGIGDKRAGLLWSLFEEE